MAFHKKDMTAPNIAGKKGIVSKFAGKGSQAAPMPNRNTLAGLAKPAGQGINNYAKASPMGAPSPDVGSGAMGLGSGNWAGNGM